MRNGLFPILLTLAILTIGFGLWFEGRNHGWFYRKAAEDIMICGNAAKDTLYLRWARPEYSITGLSTTHSGDSIYHVEVDISRSYLEKMRLSVDTSTMRYLELYGKMYKLEEIPLCD